MPHAAFRRGAVVAWLACCAPLPGCADAGGDGAALAGHARFDGWYQGRQTPLSINASNCRSGRAGEVWFEVENGAIEMRNARRPRNARKQSLLGTVSADGSVAMRHGGGGRSVAGRIAGGHLTAATVRDAQDIRAVQAGGKAPWASATRPRGSVRQPPAPPRHRPSVSRSPDPKTMRGARSTGGRRAGAEPWVFGSAAHRRRIAELGDEAPGLRPQAEAAVREGQPIRPPKRIAPNRLRPARGDARRNDELERAGRRRSAAKRPSPRSPRAEPPRA